MSKETTPEAGANGLEGTQDDAPKTVSKAEFDKVVGQRQDLKAKLRDSEAKISEFEAEKKELADAKLREQGEFKKLLEAEQAKSAELNQRLSSMVRDSRVATAIDAVTSKLEADRSVVHAMMLLQEKQGVDIAPEEVSTDFVDTMAGRIKDLAPQLFAPKGVGGTPGTPGSDTPEGRENARIKRLAKKYSKGSTA